jgi:ketosteroid isomerase-like protein
MTTKKSATDEAVIRALVESWVKGCTRNINGILAIDSPEISTFDFPGPTRSTGIEAYKRTLDVCFSWSRESGAFNVSEMNIAMGSDVAFVAGLVRCAGTASSEEREELRLRLTICLHKIGDQWIVTHEYHSIPAIFSPWAGTP